MATTKRNLSARTAIVYHRQAQQVTALTATLFPKHCNFNFNFFPARHVTYNEGVSYLR